MSARTTDPLGRATSMLGGSFSAEPHPCTHGTPVTAKPWVGAPGTVGTIGPGVMLFIVDMVHRASHTHLVESLTWQTYAAAGLFCGLGGWAIIHAIMERWERHADGIVSRPFRYFDGDDSTYQDDPWSHHATATIPDSPFHGGQC